jgi:hypothetical protein
VRNSHDSNLPFYSKESRENKLINFVSVVDGARSSIRREIDPA